jgi:hypothetical protein
MSKKLVELESEINRLFNELGSKLGEMSDEINRDVAGNETPYRELYGIAKTVDAAHHDFAICNEGPGDKQYDAASAEFAGDGVERCEHGWSGPWNSRPCGCGKPEVPGFDFGDSADALCGE